MATVAVLVLAALLGPLAVSQISLSTREDADCEGVVDPARWSEAGSSQQLRQRIAYQAWECGSLAGYTPAQVRSAIGEPREIREGGRAWFYLVGQGGERCLFQSDSVHLYLTFGEGGRVVDAETYCT